MSIKVDSFKVRRDFVLVTFDRHGRCYGGLVHVRAAEEFSFESMMEMVTQLYGDLPWLPFIKCDRVEEVVPLLDGVLSGIKSGVVCYDAWERDMCDITRSFGSAYMENRRNMIEHYSHMKKHEEPKPYYMSLTDVHAL